MLFGQDMTELTLCKAGRINNSCPHSPLSKKKLSNPDADNEEIAKDK